MFFQRNGLGENEPLIRFEWFTGRVREYPCKVEAYDQAWKIFQAHWVKRGAA